MKAWLLRGGTVLALAFLVFTFTNASWLADQPRGYVRQIAMGGIAQYPVGTGKCADAAIEPPMHDYIANTVASAVQARRMAAALVAVDVAATADGRIVAFGDETLDCLTDGSGPVRAKTLAELQALDVGYGYTADSGKTHPLRGKGVGAMPALEEILKALPENAILYRLASASPGDADLLVKTLRAAGRHVEQRGDAFYGTSAQLARIKAQFPKVWAWDEAAAQSCSSQYVAYGWTGIMPDACKGGTMVIPLDSQWEFWGWPNRLIGRMEAAGGSIVITGPEGERGISLPEEIGEIPASFNGYMQVADMWNIGPALHSSIDRRNGREIDLAEKALEARRAKR